MITPLEKITLGQLHIQYIDENHLPQKQSVSAVFLLGFIDGQIIATRNERGWDVPGGHVEPGDTNLLSALQREVKEESGVIIDGQAIPFATLQFEGNDKQMLFYTSRDCRLSDFIPSQDAFERSLMRVDDFIACYNSDKKVIEILIARALTVLKS
ncbi:MAG: NUDIX domain-containing protein [Bacteroidales bacterium]